MLEKISGNKVIEMVSCVLSFISILISIRFYIYYELEKVLFIVLLISLVVTFILDTIISHKIYKARTNKFGDILTIFNILSFGLLRPIFLFALKNKPIKVKEN